MSGADEDLLERILRAPVYDVAARGATRSGRVLAGLEVPASDTEELDHFLDDLGYTWIEETGNPAAALFLG